VGKSTWYCPLLKETSIFKHWVFLFTVSINFQESFIVTAIFNKNKNLPKIILHPPIGNIAFFGMQVMF
jgi:hypothetical protein